jgi:nucleoside-diphosphate-sugar epimerase
VAERLVADGHEVTILSRAREPTKATPQGVRVCTGDLVDTASLQVACASQDAVVNAAGIVGAAGTWPDYRRVNVTGTRLLIRAAVAAGVPRLVHLSSLIVHAESTRGELIREGSPLLTHVAGWNHYARSKLLAERAIRRVARTRRIATVVIRPGLVFGPRDRWTTPWLLRVLSRPAQLMVGDGGNAIPCVAVEDLADAISRAVKRPAEGSEVFDIAATRPMTQRGLLTSHAQAVGVSFRPVRIPVAASRAVAALLDMLEEAKAVQSSPSHRMAMTMASVNASVDCSRAGRELGWRGSASCEDAIRRAVEWQLAHDTRCAPEGYRARHAPRRRPREATT